MPIAKAWSDIYSELTDETEDAPPQEIYAALDKVRMSNQPNPDHWSHAYNVECLDEYWAAIQEVTRGLKNDVGDFTRSKAKSALEDNLKQFKITGPEFVKITGPWVDSAKLKSWVDRTYEYLNAGIDASK